MSRLLKNKELRWFILTFVVTAGSLAAAFFLQAAGQQATAERIGTYSAGSFSFSAPLELTGHPPSSLFYASAAEPEIKADVFGNIYVTAISGIPGGTDLWKSTNKGTSFQYLGQPDGAQDHCATLLECPAAGGGDDSIDVSNGGYLYVSSLWLGSVTMSTSYDGGTGGVEPGQKWEVNPAAATIPGDDRQWIAAYGPQTVYMSYTDIPTGTINFQKSTDAGKTFSAPVQTYDLTSSIFSEVQGNMAVDQYNGNIYMCFIPSGALNQIYLVKSTNGGATFTLKKAYEGPAGTSNVHVFPTMAVDRGGNIHIAVSSCGAGNTNCQIYMVSSPAAGANGVDTGNTWLDAVRVSNGAETITAVEPTIVAGSPGVVNITWLGSAAATPDVARSWRVFFAQTRNALAASPALEQNVVSPVMHDQDICFNGLACASDPGMSPGNRDLLEYYSMALDPDGNANIAYADSVTNCRLEDSCRTKTWYIKQTSGAAAYAPPAPPAPATFGPNKAVGAPGAEPSIWVDSFNCIYVTAPGNPWLWKSVDNGASFLAPVNPVADEPTLTGGDEDVISLPKPDGTRPDQLYFTDLGLSSDHIRKSTDGGTNWFKPGTGGVAGDVAISSDRQWLAGDRGAPTASDQVIYHWEHELVSEAMRISSLVNDTAWQSTSGMTEPELFDPITSTLPNTNPGPIFVNKTTHRGFALFNGSVVRNNANDPPFGKLLNVWSTDFAPPLNAAAPVTDVRNRPVFKGVYDSPSVPAPPAGTTTYGANNANIFPAGDIDSAGNIYVAWSVNNARTNEFSVWFAASHDNGQTFYGPFPVSTGPMNADETAVFPWVAAGDNGRVDIVWYQSSTVGDPNAMPASAEWNVMFAQSLNANAREPVFTVSKVSDHVMHKGSISTGGLIGSSDRSLLDFFEVAIGPDGLANIAYADNGPAPNGSPVPTHAEYARQNSGPLAKANPTSPTCLAAAPSPSPTATATATPTATPAASPTATPTASPTATPTATATATATPTATPTPTPTATPTVTPSNVQLLNISGRVFVQTGDKIGFGGFIISGATGTKKIIARAIGPSMQSSGGPVPGRLSDTVLELHAQDGHTIRANDNWREGQENEIQQSGLAPSDNREAAVIAPLPNGQYTAQIAGARNETGIGLIEIYDLESGSSGELGNLSTRGEVKTGDNVLINGLILKGGTPKRVLFRVIGPSLQSLPGTLADPTLELFDANGMSMRMNDNWRDAPNAKEIEDTGLAPTNNKEPAILMTLSPANYTAVVRSADGSTGIAIAEAYKLNN